MTSSNQQFSQLIKTYFSKIFNIDFETDRQIVEYYQNLSSNDRKQIKWEQISNQINMQPKQAYKYFTTTYQKDALDKWPSEIKENALNLCEQLFSKYYQKEISEEELRYDIIQAINEQMHLKDMKEYHYDTIYFSLRSRIHLLLCRKQSSIADIPLTTQNNSVETIKQVHTQENNKDVSDLLTKLFMSK
ncbi:Conserved_hypothetical protein [Hexamita inflata]|uniref:Uncharacterized protein n=1 Tax=Hexamita inflata TaxID=28002 RepID=A0AA86UQS6_9EUKA|nr:Conserved hypothetical protein [Hexamita inflata]CAI9947293.1 Conserved hypothetical protein [Hexamita inflata]